MLLTQILRLDTNICKKLICSTSMKILNRQPCKMVFFRTFFYETDPDMPKPVSEKTVNELKVKDRVPKEYNLIYRAPSPIYFKICHIFIMTSAFSVPIGILVALNRNNYKFPIKVDDMVVLNNLNELFGFVGIATLVGTLTTLIISRYTLRIYQNSKTNDYIACYTSPLFIGTNQRKFLKGEVKKIDESKMKIHQVSNFLLKGKKTIIYEDFFRRPVDLQIMMDDDKKTDSDKMIG